MDVPDGTYILTANSSGYVSRERTGVVVVEGSATVPSVQLRTGLVNDDNVVNINDITATVASFGTTTPTHRDSLGRFVDVNCDGVVNINDITAVVSNFGASSPQTWP